MTAPSATKSALRARLLAARLAVPADVHAAEASALANWLAGLAGLPRPAGAAGPAGPVTVAEPVTVAGTVCGYVPVGSEPGSVAMLDVLVAAGCSVLLPVVVGDEPLDWAAYQGADALAPARFGLLEPVGPRLGAGAVRSASTVLVPALAVDRRGVRLGRGAGHYDRTLALIDDAELIAIVRDQELIDTLPTEPHDIPMTAALTPTTGLTPLP